MSLTEGVTSPDLFRKWTGIGLVAGALERRVWVRAGVKITYPNLYILLVAPPGVGKYVIEEARALWTETKEPGSIAPAFHVAPDNMTKASLIDTLVKTKSIKLVPRGQALIYHSLLIASEEFQVLLPDFDQEYIGTLNSLFNNKSIHSESRRFGPAREIVIENPQINILAGVQPSYFVSTFPEEAWTTGFARRIIMVYCGKTPFKELFYDPPIEHGLRQLVLDKLGRMSQLYGEAKWAAAAVETIADWHRAGRPPEPQHSKLAHYNNSRSMFAIKLALISTVSRTGGLLVELVDVKRALAWLLEAEALMPDVFREMIGKSDTQVIEEMYYYLLSRYNAAKQKPIRGEEIIKFLLTRVPSEKADKILSMAERANILARVAGTQDLWVPKSLIREEE